MVGVKVALLGCTLIAITMTTFYLTLWVASLNYPIVSCFAPHVTESKPGSETFRRSPSPTESGIDI